MAARGQDTLTQIQKYKAMLSSKRNKGEDKAIRKPKKKRLRKENVETGLETVLGVPGLAAVPEKQQSPNELRTENLKQENVDSADLKASTVLPQESKQSAELLTTVGELGEQMSTKLSTEDQEPNKEGATGISADVGPTVDEKEDEKQKEKKSKGLSIRKKRKKFTKKRKETAEKEPSIALEGEDEEKLKEEFSCKESTLEQGDNSVVLLSPETKKEESGVEMNSEQDVEEKEANNKENKPKEGAEGKEKISRAEKFKRWASFTKQKKTNDAVVTENESYDSEISKSTRQAIQIPVSLAAKATEGDLKDDNLTDVEEVENPAKEKTGNETKVLESSPLPKKQRRRSVSLDEATDKEKETLSQDNEQRIRSASFGKGNILGSLSASLRRDRSKKKSEEISNQDDTVNGVEAASSQVDKIPDLVVETSSWKTQNNKNVNEAESKQELEQKTTKSIVEDGEQSCEVTGGYSAELDQQESPKKDEQPKKKKKSFLRKISSKNLKVNKKDEETTTEKPRKLEISAPLLIKSENQVVESYFKTVGEVGPEKPNKRKKSGLNVKLPKALKRIKSPDYKVIAGAEAEKEIEKDEPLTQDNVEQTEKNYENYEQSQESEEMCSDSLNADETQSGDTNADSKEKSECREESTEDGEVYSFCRALMNDVIKELTDRLTNLEQLASEEENNEVHNDDDDDDNDETVEESTVVNDSISSVFEDLTSLEDDNSLSDVPKKEEEDNCKELTYYVDESAIAPEGGKEKTGQSSISENVQEQPEENNEQESTLQPEIILESKERKELKESNEMEKSSCEIDEKVQEHSSQDEETNQPESEPKQSEDIPKQPEDLPQGPESELKQPEDEPKEPEDEPKQPDNILKTEQPEHVAEQNADFPPKSEVSSEESENEMQPSEDKVMTSEGTSKLYDSEVSVLEKSTEVSMKTQALMESYILIGHSFQLSQEFLQHVEKMALNGSNKRKLRCNIM